MPEVLTAVTHQEMTAHRSTEASYIGNAALRGGVILGPHEADMSMTLSESHIRAITLISMGNTMAQVGRGIGCDLRDARKLRNDVMNFFFTKSITAATNKSIVSGLIPVEVNPEPEVALHISGWDRKTLRLYARGVSNRQIAMAGNKDISVIEGYHDRLLKRIGAWSRPHAIRRAYELGIMQTRNSRAA